MNRRAERGTACSGLNPLLIGAQCELSLLAAFLGGTCLNPLLIGAQCEQMVYVARVNKSGLNPLLIGAQCEPHLRVTRRFGVVSIPF